MANPILSSTDRSEQGLSEKNSKNVPRPLLQGREGWEPPSFFNPINAEVPRAHQWHICIWKYSQVFSGWPLCTISIGNNGKSNLKSVPLYGKKIHGNLSILSCQCIGNWVNLRGKPIWFQNLRRFSYWGFLLKKFPNGTPLTKCRAHVVAETSYSELTYHNIAKGSSFRWYLYVCQLHLFLRYQNTIQCIVIRPSIALMLRNNLFA